MSQIEKITSSVYRALDEINLQLDDREKIEKSIDAVLFDTSGGLTSLVLVHFIVEVEQRIADDCGESINLMGDTDLSGDSNPFKTVGSVVNYIDGLLKIN